MKSKECKQLEAQYRLAKASFLRYQRQVQELGDERDSDGQLPSWREVDRRTADRDLAEARALMDRLDTVLRAKGYWYSGSGPHIPRINSESF